MGWGSGTANYPYLISPLQAIQAKARIINASVSWVIDNYAAAAINATAPYKDASIVVRLPFTSSAATFEPDLERSVVVHRLELGRALFRRRQSRRPVRSAMPLIALSLAVARSQRSRHPTSETT